MLIFVVKFFVVYKIFNVTLKFEGKIFMAEIVIIIIEKATHENPMVISVCYKSVNTFMDSNRR